MSIKFNVNSLFFFCRLDTGPHSRVGLIADEDGEDPPGVLAEDHLGEVVRLVGVGRVPEPGRVVRQHHAAVEETEVPNIIVFRINDTSLIISQSLSPCPIGPLSKAKGQRHGYGNHDRAEDLSADDVSRLGFPQGGPVLVHIHHRLVEVQT